MPILWLELRIEASTVVFLRKKRQELLNKVSDGTTVLAAPSNTVL
jgi:hypothetical protein